MFVICRDLFRNMSNPIKAVFLAYCTLLTVTTFSNVLCHAEQNTWAVLVSSTVTYRLYAAEAAIYKNYHQLIARGIPKENIIVFSFDLVAHNLWNLYPGTVYFSERQVGPNSLNVYDGVAIDYAGVDCTAENFMAVLAGNRSAVTSGSGKVLNSDDESTVLIYYVGYNYRNSLVFRGVESFYSFLAVEKFVQQIDRLYDDGKYDKMLIVFDAMKSGKIFDNYLENKNRVIAVTSTGIKGGLYVCELEKSLSVYTTPCFSSLWLKYLEKEPHRKLWDVLSSLKTVYREKVGLTPELYGQLNMAEQTLDDWLTADSDYTATTTK